MEPTPPSPTKSASDRSAEENDGADVVAVSPRASVTLEPEVLGRNVSQQSGVPSLPVSALYETACSEDFGRGIDHAAATVSPNNAPAVALTSGNVAIENEIDQSLRLLTSAVPFGQKFDGTIVLESEQAAEELKRIAAGSVRASVGGSYLVTPRPGSITTQQAMNNGSASPTANTVGKSQDLRFSNLTRRVGEASPRPPEAPPPVALAPSPPSSYAPTQLLPVAPVVPGVAMMVPPVSNPPPQQQQQPAAPREEKKLKSSQWNPSHTVIPASATIIRHRNLLRFKRRQKASDNIISNYRVGDLSTRLTLEQVREADFEPVEFIPLTGMTVRRAFDMNDDAEVYNPEMDEELLIDFTKSQYTCTYRLLFCKLRNRRAIAWIVLNLAAAMAFLLAAIYYAVVHPKQDFRDSEAYEWADVPFWRYCLFFALFLAMPFISDLIVHLFLALLKLVSTRRINKPKRRKLPPRATLVTTKSKEGKTPLVTASSANGSSLFRTKASTSDASADDKRSSDGKSDRPEDEGEEEENEVQVSGSGGSSIASVFPMVASKVKGATKPVEDLLPRLGALSGPASGAHISPMKARMAADRKATMVALYFIQSLQNDIVRLTIVLLDLIVFSSIFSDYPRNIESWVSAYRYVIAVFGTLAVLCVGILVTKYLTHSVTSEVNSQTLGSSIRNTLRGALIVWRLSGLDPSATDRSILRNMDDEFLVDDPETAKGLARAVQESEMCARLKRRLPGPYRKHPPRRVVTLRTEREGALMGAALISMMLSAGLKKDTSYMLLQKAFGNRSGPGNDMSSTQAQQQANEANERNKEHDFVHQLNRYKAFPWLDLAKPAVLDVDWIDDRTEMMFRNRAVGLVRGTRRRLLRKSDLAAALKESEARDSLEENPLPRISVDDAWAFFDPDRLGYCTLRRARNVVANLCVARSNLRKTLEDAAKVVDSLENVISIFVGFCVFLCALAIFGLDAVNLFISISSLILAFSFSFGSTLKNAFESAIFLFGVHPFDVGDKLKLGPQEDVYFVNRISLFTTILSRWDGSQYKIFNWQLINMQLINVNYSSRMGITLHWWFDANAIPTETQLEEIQNELEMFLAKKRSAYTGQCSVTVREVNDMLKARVTVWMEFSYSDIDGGRTFRDRSRVIIFLIDAFRRRGCQTSGMGPGRLDLQRPKQPQPAVRYFRGESAAPEHPTGTPTTMTLTRL